MKHHEIPIRTRHMLAFERRSPASQCSTRAWIVMQRLPPEPPHRDGYTVCTCTNVQPFAFSESSDQPLVCHNYNTHLKIWQISNLRPSGKAGVCDRVFLHANCERYVKKSLQLRASCIRHGLPGTLAHRRIEKGRHYLTSGWKMRCDRHFPSTVRLTRFRAHIACQFHNLR